MSTLSNLLRTSRLSHVPKSRVSLKSKEFHAKFYPTHQIIETRPDCLARQEWGLKSNIPSRIKSKYLIYDDLDTLERITTFEPLGGMQWTRLRFQEMGVVPQLQQGKRNPLFKFEEVVGSSLNSVGEDQLRELCNELGITETTKNAEVRKALESVKQRRGEFKEWLLRERPEALLNKGFNAEELKHVARQFLKEKFNPASIPKSGNARIVGSGGLSYKLKGRLTNSPNGVIQSHIVPGRIVTHGNKESNKAAVGGFIVYSSGPGSKMYSYKKGDFIRESVYPLRIENAIVDNEGRVNITANNNVQVRGGGSAGSTFGDSVYGRRYTVLRQHQRKQQQMRQRQANEARSDEDVNAKASDLIERLRNMSITR